MPLLDLAQRQHGMWSDMHTHTHNCLTPFFQDYLGELVPEEIFWTLWCKGRHQRPTHRQSRWVPLHPDKSVTHLYCPPIFMPDALPATTLAIYPGLGQAPSMLACISSGYVWSDMIVRKLHFCQLRLIQNGIHVVSGCWCYTPWVKKRVPP